MPKDDLYWRIATSEADLEFGANFFIRGIPIPDNLVFTEFVVQEEAGLGGLHNHGYSRVVLTWLNLKQKEIGAIVDFTTSNPVYATVPNNTHSSRAYNWVDIQAVPVIRNQTGFKNGSRGMAIDAFELTFNDVVILNSPSTIVGGIAGLELDFSKIRSSIGFAVL